MKAPKRRRPLLRVMGVPDGVDLKKLAASARYIGSPEHKDTPSFAGHPRPYANASICDMSLARSQDQITEWLRAAILNGHIGSPWESGFPRYVWSRQGDVVYEARLVNAGLGEYKGYPLDDDEWPKGI